MQMPKIEFFHGVLMWQRAIISGATAFLLLIYYTLPCMAQTFPTRFAINVIHVTSTDQPLDVGLKIWSDLFGRMAITLLLKRTPELQNGDLVTVIPSYTTAPPSVNDLKRNWEDIKAIEVVDAISVKNTSDTTIVYNVYLGDLKGNLDTPLLSIRQIIRASDYAADRDLITLTLLYALAVDARGHPPIACALLDTSQLIARDVRLREIGLTALDDAIQQSLRDERCVLTR